MTLVLAIIIIAIAAISVAFYKKPRKRVQLPEVFKELLEKHVSFYRALDEARRVRFENKIKEFLGYI
jgi:hypothetical protein